MSCGCCKGKVFPWSKTENDDLPRQVYSKLDSEESPFCDNTVKTSKYTLCNFPIKNLREQFSRKANVYFLVISLLQVSTDLSPTNKFATIIPLTLVLLFNMIKEGIEDLGRRRADNNINNSLAWVLRPKGFTLKGLNDAEKRTNTHNSNAGDYSFIQVPWWSIQVGDIIKVWNKSSIPADIAVIASSERTGIAYIETSNLDGETNLKLRMAIFSSCQEGKEQKHQHRQDEFKEMEQSGHSKYTDPVFLSKWTGCVEYQGPNPDLYSFEGALDTGDSAGKRPLGLSNVIWRGTSLRNTDFVIGMVLYTGQDSKLIRNSRSAPSKRSAVDRTVDVAILVIFAALATICTASTVLHDRWLSDSNNNDAWYLRFREDGLDVALTWITFLILYNNLVPISLYVSLEIVKLVQSKLIADDLEMYYADADTPASARTSNLNEDLGQIQYVFADKTGTLTCNKMEFANCSVGGRCYGMALGEGDQGHDMQGIVSWLDTQVAREAGLEMEEMKKDPPTSLFRSLHVLPTDLEDTNVLESIRRRAGLIAGRRGSFLEAPLDEEDTFDAAFDPQSFLHDLKCMPGPDWPEERATQLYAHKEKLINFLICVGVCHTVVIDGEGQYNANSPDEAALLNGIKPLGAEFFQQGPGYIKLRILGKEMKIDILNVNELSSKRKRMSVVARMPDGKIMIFCKGADEVMLPLMSASFAITPDYFLIDEHLTLFASSGLRTLVLGMAELDPSLYQQWNQRFQEAKNTLSEREAKLHELAVQLESGFSLVGVTAVLDQLQNGVPQTISKLTEAGIKVWMLTGDKLQTAQNIGVSCCMLNEEQELVKLTSTDPSVIGHTLADAIKRNFAFISSTNPNLAVLVEGLCLAVILSHPHLKSLFIRLCMMVKTVVACRMIPLQKKQIVNLIKQNIVPTPMTLAIGDGANDVSMIQQAHVGVGISGNEGMQAVRASDYAIGQFRFLQRLLLVHGHWNYRRVSLLILYSFYKNITNVLTLFYYGFHNGFTGTTLYESFLGAGWNVGWTFFPVLCFGIFEQDVSAEYALAFPIIYQSGMERSEFSVSKMIQWVFNAFLHSVVIYGISVGVLSDHLTEEGRPIELFLMGTMINLCTVLVVNYKIALHTKYWTIWNVLAFFGSIILWLLFVLVYAQLYSLSSEFYGIATQLFSGATLWLLIALVPIAALITDVVANQASRDWKPTLSELIRERQLLNMDTNVVDHKPFDARASMLKKSFQRMDTVFALPIACLDTLLAPSSQGVSGWKIESYKRVAETMSILNNQTKRFFKKSVQLTARKNFRESSASDADKLTEFSSGKRPYHQHATISLAVEVDEDTYHEDTYFSHEDEGKRAIEDNGRVENKSEPNMVDTIGTSTASSEEQKPSKREDKSSNSNRSSTILEEAGAHWLTLTFADHFREETFQKRYMYKSLDYCRRALTVVWVLICIYALISVINDEDSYVLRIVATVFGGIALLLVWSQFFTRIFYEFLFVVMLSGGFAKTILVTENGSLGMGMYAIVCFLMMRTRFHHALVACAIDLPVFCIFVWANDIMSSYELLRMLVAYLTIAGFTAYVSQRTERAYRVDYLLQIEDAKEKERTQEILDNLLPSFIFDIMYEHKEQRAMKERGQSSRITARESGKGTPKALLRSFKGSKKSGESSLLSMPDDDSNDKKDIGLRKSPQANRAQAAAAIVDSSLQPSKVKSPNERDAYSNKQRRVSRKMIEGILRQSLTVASDEVIGRTLAESFSENRYPKGGGRDDLVKARNEADVDLVGIFGPETPDHPSLSMIDPFLNSFEVIIASSEPAVSILFCEVVGLNTMLASRSQANEVVSLLGSIYTMFDELCVPLGVKKMETVGKTWMGCCGLMGTRKDHAEGVCEMAEHMVALMRANTARNGKEVQVRIGIHSGPVITGLVGLVRPQFSLFGDTVNTSSRMMTNGVTGKIHISEATYELVKDVYCIEEERQIPVKGKGFMQTFILGARNSKLPYNRKIQLRPQISGEANIQAVEQMIKEADPSYESLMEQDKEQSQSDSIVIKPFRLRFERQKDETRYMKSCHRSAGVKSRQAALLCVCFYFIEAFFWQDAEERSSNDTKAIFVIEMLFVFFGLVLIWASYSDHFARNAASYNAAFYFLGLAHVIAVPAIIDANDEEVLAHRSVQSYLLCLTLLSNNGTVRFLANFVAVAAAFLMWCVSAAVTNGTDKFLFIFFVLCGCIINLLSSYFREYYQRREYILMDRVRYQRNRAEEFLYSMLPRDVAVQLRLGKALVCDNYKQVSILYSDIKGFTTYSARNSPATVVELLKQLFSAFDELSKYWNVYKVQTIGDAYVLVGGFPFTKPEDDQDEIELLSDEGYFLQPEARHAINVIQMGIDMLAVIKRIRTKDANIEMRIGVHTGDIVAGTIGQKQLRYDIWGTDCLVANHFESEGLPSGVLISGQTASYVKQQYRLVRRPDVVVKGVGAFDAYAVHYNVNEPERRLRIIKPDEKVPFVPERMTRKESASSNLSAIPEPISEQSATIHLHSHKTPAVSLHELGSLAPSPHETILLSNP